MSKETAREIYNHLKATSQAFCFTETGELVAIGQVMELLGIKA